MKPFIIAFLFLLPLESHACVELIENSRVHEMTYNFYANNGQDSCVRLPYVRKDFEAKGVHITNEDIAYISMSHKDENLSSRVVQSDAKTGKVLKTYDLMGKNSRGYKGAVDSITLIDKNSKFAVPSKDSICVFDKRNASLSLTGLYKAPLLFCQKQKNLFDRQITFLSHSPNQKGAKYIWVVSKKRGETSKIFGYKIIGKRVLESPSYTFDVPKAVSGVESLAILKEVEDSNYSFLLQTKKGINLSKMYKVDYKYNRGTQKFTSTLTAQNFKNQSREPASKLLALSDEINLKLPKKSPKYLKENIPTLHETLKSMKLKNLPFLPPK